MDDDQRAYWEATHRRGRPSDGPRPASAFAREVARLLPACARLLEIGCGPGTDAAFFAEAGHRIAATDFSGVAIHRNQRDFADLHNVAMAVVDARRPLPFRDGAFDAVYARLSLHYFPDATTKAAFGEIHRVLAPGGLLAFLCKSTADPLYGLGERMAPDIYRLEGHVRHFFSEEYARACLAVGFDMQELWSGPMELYGQPSAVVRAIATRR